MLSLLEDLIFLFSIVCLKLAVGEKCGDDVARQSVTPEADWMESEVVAGFRVWQILFLVLAGIITLIVVLCCLMRCRIPRTRQEIEANHKRSQITLLFRAYLDRVHVEEVDLPWALEIVKTAMEKRKSRRKKKKSAAKMVDPDNADPENPEEEEMEEDEEERPKKLSVVERFRNAFKQKEPILDSDEDTETENRSEELSLRREEGSLASQSAGEGQE